MLLADQVTKSLAREYLHQGGARSVALVGEYIRLTYVENRGTAFGLLQNQTAFPDFKFVALEDGLARCQEEVMGVT